MNLFPLNSMWQDILFFHRFLRHRKGFGVHSPFAYSFITKIIEERYGYYCYDDIHLVRRQLEHQGNRLARKDISRKHGELLFRTVNFFKPERLVQIGSPAGIGALYMTAYSSKIRALILEKDELRAETTARSLGKYRSGTQIRQGDYVQTLPVALKELKEVDFVFFQTAEEKEKTRSYFEEAKKYSHPDTVFFIEGIRKNQEMRTVWKEVCEREDVRLTFDLFHLGIVIFQPRFHKKNYRLYY